MGRHRDNVYCGILAQPYYRVLCSVEWCLFLWAKAIVATLGDSDYILAVYQAITEFNWYLGRSKHQSRTIIYLREVYYSSNHIGDRILSDLFGDCCAVCHSLCKAIRKTLCGREALIVHFVRTYAFGITPSILARNIANDRFGSEFLQQIN